MDRFIQFSQSKANMLAVFPAHHQTTIELYGLNTSSTSTMCTIPHWWIFTRISAVCVAIMENIWFISFRLNKLHWNRETYMQTEEWEKEERSSVISTKYIFFGWCIRIIWSMRRKHIIFIFSMKNQSFHVIFFVLLCKTVINIELIVLFTAKTGLMYAESR